MNDLCDDFTDEDRDAERNELARLAIRIIDRGRSSLTPLEDFHLRELEGRYGRPLTPYGQVRTPAWQARIDAARTTGEASRGAR